MWSYLLQACRGLEHLHKCAAARWWWSGNSIGLAGQSLSGTHSGASFRTLMRLCLPILQAQHYSQGYQTCKHAAGRERPADGRRSGGGWRASGHMRACAGK